MLCWGRTCRTLRLITLATDTGSRLVVWICFVVRQGVHFPFFFYRILWLITSVLKGVYFVHMLGDIFLSSWRASARRYSVFGINRQVILYCVRAESKRHRYMCCSNMYFCNHFFSRCQNNGCIARYSQHLTVVWVSILYNSNAMYLRSDAVVILTCSKSREVSRSLRCPKYSSVHHAFICFSQNFKKSLQSRDFHFVSNSLKNIHCFTWF